jgi:polysaccharide biosynthesis protein PslH
MKILYISTRIPFPTTSGDRMIIYNRLIRTYKKHEISLIAFYQNDDDLKGLKHLEFFFEKIWTIKVTKFDGLVNLASNFFISQDPLQVMYYNSNSTRKKVQSIIGSNKFDLINAYLIRVTPFIKGVKIPIVLDMIDSMQLNFLNRIKNANNFLKYFFYKYEYNRLVKFELSLSGFDRAIFVSKRDGKMVPFKSSIIPLGVDTEIFKPAKNNSKKIIFSGNMSYEPNIQAITWFIENCWDSIVCSVSGVQLIIAGMSPTPEIKKLESDNVVVTGYVDSMAELISKSSVAITPMVSGSGMQTKLLEAMSCEIPIVSTSYGVGDVKARHMKEILISNSALDFSNYVIDVLLNPEKYDQIAVNGRRFVVENYSWDSHIESLMQVYNSILKKKGEI